MSWVAGKVEAATLGAERLPSPPRWSVAAMVATVPEEAALYRLCPSFPTLPTQLDRPIMLAAATASVMASSPLARPAGRTPPISRRPLRRCHLHPARRPPPQAPLLHRPRHRTSGATRNARPRSRPSCAYTTSRTSFARSGSGATTPTGGTSCASRGSRSWRGTG